MRAVVQRVKKAKVVVDKEIKGEIEAGILLFLGIDNSDSEKDSQYILEKLINLRIFEDEKEKMNLSLCDIKGELLIVSQFTICGDCRKGRRPNFMSAAKPEKSIPIYEDFVKRANKYGIKVATGVFGAHMDVEIVNDGPVTILIDSKKEF